MKTISFAVLAITFCCGLVLSGCEGTDAPECDGDGGETGCPAGYYCAIDNTCQQDCVEDHHCLEGRVCNQFGCCVEPKDGGF